MTLPVRMNPVETTILLQDHPNENERIDDSTVRLGDNGDVQFGYDEDFREPSGKRQYKDPIVVTPQVATRRFNEMIATITGEEPEQDGHLTFRKSDLDKENINLQSGDKIIKMADFDVDLIIEEVQPRAPLRGRFILIEVQYKHNVNKRSGETT